MRGKTRRYGYEGASFSHLVSYPHNIDGSDSRHDPPIAGVGVTFDHSVETGTWVVEKQSSFLVFVRIPDLHDFFWVHSATSSQIPIQSAGWMAKW